MSVISAHGQFYCLIIDDSKVDQMIGKSLIENVPGVVCECAWSGQEGINKCKSRHYECVVLDYNMPGLNGMQTAQEILAYDRSFYILGCTTEVENPEIVRTWQQVGLQEVLPKSWILVKDRIMNLVKVKSVETTCA